MQSHAATSSVVRSFSGTSTGVFGDGCGWFFMANFLSDLGSLRRHEEVGDRLVRGDQIGPMGVAVKASYSDAGVAGTLAHDFDGDTSIHARTDPRVTQIVRTKPIGDASTLAQASENADGAAGAVVSTLPRKDKFAAAKFLHSPYDF
jgi:hypothetical protein